MSKLFAVLAFLIASSSCNAQTRTYASVLSQVEDKRSAYLSQYNSGSPAVKEAVVSKAETYLIATLCDEVFPMWYGTPWDFNGTSRVPRQGNIACGYFVTNVLTDVGFKIPRIKWAQSASEVFIKELSTEQKRFHNSPIEEVNEFLTSSGDGVYLVGLDYHVGFITVRNGKAAFVHSNYYQADIGVMAESIFTENPLRDSSYRVIGKLFSSEMVVNWMLGISY